MSDLNKAIFAAGCFWGVEAYFKLVKGIVSTRVGYTGGTAKDPTYKEVCNGKTGHAEAVEMKFDPAIVSYEKLLHHFWKIHDPTSLNRQGGDVGAQYRSAIFFTNADQEKIARHSQEELENSGRYKNKIVTEIVHESVFYEAEEYHQDYLVKNPHGYCHIDLSQVSRDHKKNS